MLPGDPSEQIRSGTGRHAPATEVPLHIHRDPSTKPSQLAVALPRIAVDPEDLEIFRQELAHRRFESFEFVTGQIEFDQAVEPDEGLRIDRVDLATLQIQLGDLFEILEGVLSEKTDTVPLETQLLERLEVMERVRRDERESVPFEVQPLQVVEAAEGFHSYRSDSVPDEEDLLQLRIGAECVIVHSDQPVVVYFQDSDVIPEGGRYRLETSVAAVGGVQSVYSRHRTVSVDARNKQITKYRKRQKRNKNQAVARRRRHRSGLL